MVCESIFSFLKYVGGVVSVIEKESSKEKRKSHYKKVILNLKEKFFKHVFFCASAKI